MRWAFRQIGSPAGAGVAVLLAGLFWWYSRLPLHHTDLWGHLAYGRLIVATGGIPAQEPFMPLARGVPLVNTAWLSQVLLYAAHWLGGLTALRLLHALSIVATVGLVIARHWRRTRSGASLIAAVAIAAVLVSVEWYQWRIIRPQAFGVACFAALLLLTSTRTGLRRAAWGVPVLMAVWANLHGSFLVGIGWLVLRAAGRAGDVIRRSRNVNAAWRDRAVRRLLRLAVVGVVAACLNPYGVWLLTTAVEFSANPNLQDLLEWQPLNWQTKQAWLFAANLILLAGLVIVRRGQTRLAELVPVLALAMATCASARFIVWWGPPGAACVASLLMVGRQGCLASWLLNAPADQGMPASRFWRGATTVAWVVALLGSPLGTDLLRRERDARERVSLDTPIEAVRYLREHPPTGLVFNRYEWGDYLLWSGPDGVQVFVTSQAHLVPREVWRDYLATARGADDSLERLEKYEVATVLLDRRRQVRLEKRLAADPRWTRDYADDLAAIYVRP